MNEISIWLERLTLMLPQGSGSGPVVPPLIGSLFWTILAAADAEQLLHLGIAAGHEVAGQRLVRVGARGGEAERAGLH